MAPSRELAMRSSRTLWKNSSGIGDAVARKGVDHEALLVGGDHLLRRGVDVEDALVEIFDVLDERDLVVEPGVLDLALRLAEFEHQRLLGLVDGEQREIGHDRGNAEDDQAGGESGAVHCWLSSAGA